MKAIVYEGRYQVKVKEVADPKLEKSDDVIIRVTSTAICGSDLHLFHGMIPNTPYGFILGHETMGIVFSANMDGSANVIIQIPMEKQVVYLATVIP